MVDDHGAPTQWGYDIDPSRGRGRRQKGGLVGKIPLPRRPSRREGMEPEISNAPFRGYHDFLWWIRARLRPHQDRFYWAVAGTAGTTSSISPTPRRKPKLLTSVNVVPAGVKTGPHLHARFPTGPVRA